MKNHLLFLLLAGSLLCACKSNTSPHPEGTAGATETHPVANAAMALTQGSFVVYDPAYRRLSYPMGDVPPDRGVCADVVVRALRVCGYDLQQLVHEDMQRHFHLYPNRWGLSRPDPNIDHRRVPNIITWMQRHVQSLSPSQRVSDYRPGDVVAWQMNGGLHHIGIVVSPTRPGQRPLIVHNMGGGQVKQDVLFAWKVIGHYRFS